MNAIACTRTAMALKDFMRKEMQVSSTGHEMNARQPVRQERHAKRHERARGLDEGEGSNAKTGGGVPAAYYLHPRSRQGSSDGRGR
ncbi:MAG: hypothetical protein HS130_00980 [Deltaproteobacteria bacterium]|nr:hypothetical protein [Deltaproteobacteria bacterium]